MGADKPDFYSSYCEQSMGFTHALQENGDLEISVPRPFTAVRSAVSYTHRTLTIDIQDHPLAKTLLKAPWSPSIQAFGL